MEVMSIIVINIIIFLIFFVLFLLSRSDRHVFFDFTPKEHPLIVLYPMSYYLIHHTPLKGILHKNKSQFDLLKALYTRDNPQERVLLHWCRKLSLITLIVLLFNIISMYSFISSENQGDLLDGKFITRPDYGESDKDVDLDVLIEGKQKSIEESISIQVEERKYDAEQLREMFIKTQRYIDQVFLGENKSKDEIIYPLNLIKRMPNTRITIDWDLGTKDLIDQDGKLHNESIDAPGELVELKAIMKYEKQQADYTIFIFIKPSEVNPERQIYKELVERIKQVQESSRVANQLVLPDKINNYTIHYSEKKHSNGLNLLMFGIILSIIMGYVVDKELHKKMNIRELELLMDYPEIMNKFALLLGAGMTIKNAWGRIVVEYCEKLEGKKAQRRYAYEELLITWRELLNGVTEVTAFDNFGKRIKLLPYLKFSSLISQNLKKGSKGLLELLELEAMDAFEERKELAKRLGEEAGTKLLLPMMIMLLIVLFLIMIPAFMTL